MRVLVVEDDSAWLELLREMLEDMAFTVQPTASLEAAQAALAEGPYDLALLDLSLVSTEHDNQEGLRVLEQFRARYPKAPAIVLTGYATVDLAVEALTTLGADDLLRKEQFNRHRFQETVWKVLGVASASNTGSVDASAPVPHPPRASLDARILVVEDNPAWQNIYMELLGELGAEVALAVSYGEARGLLQREAFDGAVVDLKLASSTEPRKNRDGFYLLRLTQEMALPTLVISALAEPAAIDRAYEEFDIFAFFDKEGFQRGAFLDTLRAAILQKQVESTELEGRDSVEEGPLAGLTERQLEVLTLLAEGKTNNEIAEELIVSVNTVKKHVLAIFAALDVNTRSAAAAIAARHGLRR